MHPAAPCHCVPGASTSEIKMMQRTLPKIAIVHVNTVPGHVFEEFRLASTSPEVDVQIIAIEPPGPMAGIEWLMPAFVTGFIASAYFGGFFQEMGKDHYVLLKEQIKKLYPKVAGPDAPDVRLVGTRGKVNEAQPYSLFFALMGEGPDGLRLKLLLKRPISPEEYGRCVDAFLTILEDLNSGSLTAAVQRRFESVAPIGRTMLVVYDDALGEVVPVDPRTGAVKK